MRSAPVATLVALAVLALLAVGAFRLGHGADGAASAPSTAHAARGGATLAPPTTRMFDDRRFAITFRYPSELRPEGVDSGARDFGRPTTAATALYAPRLGFIEVKRIDDAASVPTLGRDARTLTRIVARIYRRTNARLRFRATPHVVNDLPVVELRALAGPRQGVALNVVAWVGRDAYRLICHETQEPARRAEMLRVCERAMRTLALRPDLAVAPGTTRSS